VILAVRLHQPDPGSPAERGLPQRWKPLETVPPVTVNTVTVGTDVAGRLIGVLRSTTGMPDLEYGRLPEPMRGGFRPLSIEQNFDSLFPPHDTMKRIAATGWPPGDEE
jgi:hypothetical protein